MTEENQDEQTFFERMYDGITNGLGKVYNNKYFWPVIGAGALGALIAVTSCYNRKNIETLSQQVAVGDSTLNEKLNSIVDISTENQDSLYKIGNRVYALQDSAHVLHKGIIGVGNKVGGLNTKVAILSDEIKSQHNEQNTNMTSTYKSIQRDFANVDSTLTKIQRGYNGKEDADTIKQGIEKLDKNLKKKANKGLFGWGFLNIF